MTSSLSVSYRPPSCPDSDTEEPTRDFSFSSSAPTESSMSDIDSSPVLSEQDSPTPLIPVPQSNPIANCQTATPPASQLIGVHPPTSMPECSPTAMSPDAPPYSPLTRGVLSTSTPKGSPTAMSRDAPPYSSPLNRGVLPTSTPESSPTAISHDALPPTSTPEGLLTAMSRDALPPPSTPKCLLTAVSPDNPARHGMVSN